MQLTFPYGNESLDVALPDGLQITVAQPAPMPGHDAKALLRHALDTPTGAPHLNGALKGRHECLIAVTDHTRRNAYDLWLAELLNQVNNAGIADKHIHLFIASAMRGPMSEPEKHAYFGDEVMKRVKTYDHDAATSPLVKAGRTDFGTVLLVNEKVAQAETFIITGGIRYHNFAGYTGARESILPGSCGLESINSNFKRAVDKQSGSLLPSVRPGRLSGNPFSDDMHEACMLCRPTYHVDVIMNPEGQVAWCGAGDFGYVPRIGGKTLDEHNKITVPQAVDVAIIGAGAGRESSTLYRAHKSLRLVEQVLAPEAQIVFVARCDGGEGPPMLADWRNLPVDQIRNRVAHEGTLIGLAALVIKEMTERYCVHLVSDLPDDVARAWGFVPEDSLQHAVTHAVPRFPERAHWLAGADMSNLLTVLPGAETAAH